MVSDARGHRGAPATPVAHPSPGTSSTGSSRPWLRLKNELDLELCPEAGPWRPGFFLTSELQRRAGRCGERVCARARLVRAVWLCEWLSGHSVFARLRGAPPRCRLPRRGHASCGEHDYCFSHHCLVGPTGKTIKANERTRVEGTIRGQIP